MPRRTAILLFVVPLVAGPLRAQEPRTANNLRLRPILRKTQKQGSRIASHRFTMGDWKPDKSITVKDNAGTEYHLHPWTIGAAAKK